MTVVKKAALAAAAAAFAFGAVAPAQAGGRSHGYSSHHGWSHGHYKPRKHYYYGHHRGRGRLSGGEAAIIAAGIIGGAILIDRALDDDRYQRRYEDDRYSYGPSSGRRYGSPEARDYHYRRDDRGYAPPDDYSSPDDDYRDEGELLGSYDGAGVAPGSAAAYNYGAAYNDCKAETRAAADQGGLFVALPSKPQRITPIDGGDAVRFISDFIAQDRHGGEVKKTMVCEADLEGVRFLELV